MAVTRRGLFKGALTAAALALVSSLPGLPQMAQRGCWWGRVVTKPAPNPLLAEYQYSGPGLPLSHLRAFWPLPSSDPYIELSSQLASAQDDRHRDNGSA